MIKQDIFCKYCEKYWIVTPKSKKVEDYITSTFSYKRFELQTAIDELKQSIKDMITEIKLRIKGIVK